MSRCESDVDEHMYIPKSCSWTPNEMAATHLPSSTLAHPMHFGRMSLLKHKANAPTTAHRHDTANRIHGTYSGASSAELENTRSAMRSGQKEPGHWNDDASPTVTLVDLHASAVVQFTEHAPAPH